MAKDKTIKQPDVISDKDEFKYEDRDIRLQDIFENFETISTVPTEAPNPSKFKEQIKKYKNGSTRRLYWYDSTNGEWVYATGTV